MGKRKAPAAAKSASPSEKGPDRNAEGNVGPDAVDEVEESCTFHLGTIRQRVFWCGQCHVRGRPSAVCEACEAKCHRGHKKVVDLGSKRRVHCDCGDSDMVNTCFLQPDRGMEPLSKSWYNHNYRGRFCRCDGAELGEMFQCGICEDWFHEGCLVLGGDEEDFETPSEEFELTCKACVERGPFLKRYYSLYGVLDHGVSPRSKKRKKGATTPRMNLEEPDMERREVCGAPPAREDLDGLDLLWIPGFRTGLCHCSFCHDDYLKAGMPFVNDRNDLVDPDIPGVCKVVPGLAGGKLKQRERPSTLRRQQRQEEGEDEETAKVLNGETPVNGKLTELTTELLSTRTSDDAMDAGVPPASQEDQEPTKPSRPSWIPNFSVPEKNVIYNVFETSRQRIRRLFRA